ncbi:MAG TPA: ABC transporter ATP-binding protein [Actinomycetales bacterium]|nr:ABC transporter ATP-binding protein [Actinomycetales bacterium]
MPDRVAPVTAQRGTMREGFGVVGRGIAESPRTFAVAVAASAVYGAGIAGTGWLLGRITDRVLTPAFDTGRFDPSAVWSAAGLLAGIGLLTAIGVAARRIFAGVTTANLMARYRRAVTRQYLRLPLAWHHRHPAGQLLSNANADVEATFMVFQPLPFAIGVVVMLAVASVAMLAADPVLAAVGLTVLPAVAAANVVYQRAMAPLVVRAQQLRGEVSAVAHESFDGALVVKALGREADETERFATSAHRLREANVAVGRIRGIFDPLIESLPTLGTLAVLGVGTWRVGSGAAQAGDVVQVAYLLTLLAFPVRAIGWVLGELPRSAVGWRRVASVLDATGEMTYGTTPVPSGGPVTLGLRAVTYAFAGTAGAPQDGATDAFRRVDRDEVETEAVTVLHDVDLQVRAGTTVAVVGPTGSGKSTLATLVVRLVDPAAGQVSVDGVDARQVPAGGVAEVAALVPQSTFVFDDTVRGNITLGAQVADDDVWRALRTAQADGFVGGLPDGLDTRVGERGASLSGGQRQRLAIARAVVRRPRLLVMDDATSAIDPTVEAAILAGLRSAGEGTTVVLVAYRKATIALADEVVFVERGRVVDRGPHLDLVRRQPRYTHMVNAYEEAAADRVAAEARTEQVGT